MVWRQHSEGCTSTIASTLVICSINVKNSWVADDHYCDIQDETVGIHNILKAGCFHSRLDLAEVAGAGAEIRTMVVKVEKE